MDQLFYSTRAWRQARRRALARDQHRCTAVVTIGGTGTRCSERRDVDVHHIVAIADGGDAYALGNLTTLCGHHHAWAHGNVPQLVAVRARQAERRGRKPKQRPNAGAYVLHGGRE